VTDPVDRFVGITLSRQRLDVPELVARLIALLDSAAYLIEMLPAEALQSSLPGRGRTHLDLSYHLPQVVVGFLDAALGGSLTFEHFERRPPESLQTAAQAASLVRSVSHALAVWWAASQSRLPGTLETYYGRQEFHAVLERTTWHVAQHARQLERLLELRGIRPVPPLARSLLEGLPVPEDVWDAEVQLG
jgi:hypothetical protein